ncbi:hypothetical protein ACMA5I_04845 [Paracoccaceae bacterium GXU_MW_L88]
MWSFWYVVNGLYLRILKITGGRRWPIYTGFGLLELLIFTQLSETWMPVAYLLMAPFAFFVAMDATVNTSSSPDAFESHEQRMQRELKKPLKRREK